MDGLNSEELSFYLDNGYLLLEDVIRPVDFQPLIDEIDDVIDRQARQAYEEGRLSDLFEGQPFHLRLASISSAVDSTEEFTRPLLRKRHKTAGLFRLVICPAILDIVESVIGPEIQVHPQFNLQAKMPREVKSEIPWHQDLGFLEPEAEQTFMVNFWIPLVDVTAENGCLEVIPGSHNAGLRPHGAVPGYANDGIRVGHVPEGDGLPCPLRKGGVVVFQHKTMHRSFPNRTDRIRWSLDLRYSDPALPTGRSGVPGFMARSRAHPESVARNHLDWLKLMEGVDDEM